MMDFFKYRSVRLIAVVFAFVVTVIMTWICLVSIHEGHVGFWEDFRKQPQNSLLALAVLIFLLLYWPMVAWKILTRDASAERGDLRKKRKLHPD